MKNLLGLLVLVFMLTSYGQEPQKENSLTRANLKGRVSSVDKLTYDAVEKFGEVEKDSLGFRNYTRYNEQGNMIEVNKYNPDGSFDGRYTYKYDKQGYKIEGGRYMGDGSLYDRFTSKYDEQGNEIEENTYKADGSLVWSYTWKYDEQGNQIEKNHYDSVDNRRLGYKHIYKYEYDKMGNWIKKILFEDESNGDFISLKPISVEERKIGYY